MRSNAEGLSIGQEAIDFYDSLHDLGAPSGRKTYRPAKLGYESHVYAIWINGGHISYYIRDPRFGDICHSPSICFEVIDPRVSNYWQIKHDYIKAIGKHALGEVFPRTWFAIKEWIEEPRFLEFYIDGKEREVAILESAAKLIEDEFD